MHPKLHIGNLPDDCPRESLRDVFSPYGNIDELVVIKNYGFVTFTDQGNAEKALKDLHKSKLLGKEITVQLAKPKRSDDNRNDNRRENRHDNRNDNRNRENRRSFGRDDRQRHNNMLPNPNVNLLSQLGQLGGILGAAPGPGGGPGVPALGLLNTLNAAVAGQLGQLEQSRNRDVNNIPKQQELRSVPRDQPDPDVRVRREVVHVREVPKAAELGLTSGYVIHERYYVDPSHPLLRGIPITELPRINDPKRSSPPREREQRERQRERDPYQDSTSYNPRQDDYSERHDRSPVRNRDFDYDRY